MSKPIRFLTINMAVVVLIGCSDCSKAPERNESSVEAAQTGEPPASAEGSPASMDHRTVTLSSAETQAVADFEKRVNDYAALRNKLEGELEPLGEESKPEEIELHRESLRALIKKSRATAKPGEFFTPEMLALVKRLCATTVAREGQQVESTIMDENPGKLPNVGVNDRYPDGIPVTTMPVQLLETLPKLPEYVEYRFLGKRLVLVDAGAGIVLDITPDVLT